MVDIKKLFVPVFSGKKLPSYASILKNTYGASEIYPLVNIASGTNIPAYVSAAHDGTLVGWDLKNAAGPVVGTFAPYLDGTNDYSNLGSLALIFNGGIGGAFIFAKVGDAADWSDGVTRYLFNLKADNNNWLYIIKHGTLGIRVNAIIGGVPKTVTIGVLDQNWFCVGMTWQDSNNGNAVKAFINGAQSGATQTGFGAWAGVPTICSLFSAQHNGAANVWKGWGAYHALRFGSIWTPTEMAAMYADRLVGGPDANP